MKIEHCPLCGWGPIETPYPSIRELCVSYDICECCGCEYCYDDNDAYYQNWVTNGCLWFRPEKMPPDWQLKNQLQQQIRPWPPYL